jgi:hypothetical protein
MFYGFFGDILSIFWTVISRILVVAQYEKKYGWTHIFTLYNFA